MAKTFWIQFALISILILTVASKKGGKSKGGGWSSGTNRNPSNPGSNWNPSHTGNTGGNWNPHPPNPGWNTGSNWGNNYNPAGSNYNKQMKPPKTKTNMKMVAAGAAAGVVGGYVLGSAISNMRYRFDNDMDYRYYDSYRSQMPNQVYRPTYQTQVPEERFVTDCYNTSMTEYVIKPNEGKNVSEIDQTELRVKSTVIRQLCVTEYRRGPQYSQSYDSGMNLLFSQSLMLFITLFVYFVVE